MNAVHDHPEASPEALSRIDLNLLVAFDALVREGSVTKAAERVGITQSAMSHALRRLRELFDDPLLVRGKNGMTLTTRAEAVASPLRSGLVALGRVLAAPDGFDPSTSRRAFTIVSPDLFDVVVVPALLEQLHRAAPGVDVAVLSPGRNVLARLETGELDLAVLPRMEDATDDGAATGFLRKTLFRDGYRSFVRRGHPALEPTKPPPSRGHALSMDAFLELSHVLVSPTGEGGGQVDDALGRLGRRRRVALRVPHFVSALGIVARSHLVLTGPSVLETIAPREVVAFSSPLRLPRHGVDLVWHERFAADPGHRWFRARVTEAARAAVKA